jgi:hypothetical protein
MSEYDFTETVIHDLSQWKDQLRTELEKINATADDELAKGMRRLVINPRMRLHTGSTLGWSYNDGQYSWSNFEREADVAIGFTEETTGGADEFVPLFLIELKSQSFNSDELDKKSAVYSGFRDVYPWVTRILIHKNLAEHRALHENYLFKNARGFDLILTEWPGDTGESTVPAKRTLEKYLEARLGYYVTYWGF